MVGFARMEEMSSAERLRQSLAAYKRAHAEAFVWRWRGDGEADSPGAVSSAFRSKGLAALAALDECRTLEEGETAASAAHLARAVVDGILGEAREAMSEAATRPRGSDARLGSGWSALRTLFDAGDKQVRGSAARVLLEVARSLESRLRDARQAADAEAAPLVRGVPPDGPRGADLASDARTFLLETDALSEEAVRWLSRRAEVPIEQWPDLVFACGLAPGTRGHEKVGSDDSEAICLRSASARRYGDSRSKKTRGCSTCAVALSPPMCPVGCTSHRVASRPGS